MPLNEHQERFCQEFILDLNATQAAVRAGYSKDTAYSQGHRLLKHAEVAAKIDELKAERKERLKIDTDWLLQRFVEEANADVSEIYDEHGALLPVTEWPMIWRQGLVAGLDVEEICGPEGSKIGEVKKVRLADRTKRLELIGRHIAVQAFKDRVEVTADDDMIDRIARARARGADGESS